MLSFAKRHVTQIEAIYTSFTNMTAPPVGERLKTRHGTRLETRSQPNQHDLEHGPIDDCRQANIPSLAADQMKTTHAVPLAAAGAVDGVCNLITSRGGWLISVHRSVTYAPISTFQPRRNVVGAEYYNIMEIAEFASICGTVSVLHRH